MSAALTPLVTERIVCPDCEPASEGERTARCALHLLARTPLDCFFEDAAAAEKAIEKVIEGYVKEGWEGEADITLVNEHGFFIDLKLYIPPGEYGPDSCEKEKSMSAEQFRSDVLAYLHETRELLTAKDAADVVGDWLAFGGDS